MKCFRCGGDHWIKDCPKIVKDKERDNGATSTSKDKSKDGEDNKSGSKKGTSDPPVSKKQKLDLPAWRYLEPKDLSIPLLDDGRTWKFCTKCKCNKTGRQGLYILSHFDSEHVDHWKPKNEAKTEAKNEANLADLDGSGVPPNVPAATVHSNFIDAPDDVDDIEFQGVVGAWCAPVDQTSVQLVLPENDNPDASDDDSVDTLHPVTPWEATMLAAVLRSNPYLPSDWAAAIVHEILIQSGHPNVCPVVQRESSSLVVESRPSSDQRESSLLVIESGSSTVKRENVGDESAPDLCDTAGWSITTPVETSDDNFVLAYEADRTRQGRLRRWCGVL